MSEIPRGRSETHDGDTHVLRFVVELPHPVPEVWKAVASPEGLADWLCAVDPLEPRLGGRVTLHRLTSADTEDTGRVTAWDPERVTEYTVDPTHGRIRFRLEPGPGPGGDGSTVLRFTNELRGPREHRFDRLAAWHDHFELLARALDGHPADWRERTSERWGHLRELYEREDAPWPKWEP
ncbi:SRPBCC domain-containing protein [Streptomyces exfoliatus]|uniref:SRPBCC domain-containing protein n=1 Tax=Streptomyces exfoliatus TaxID=1905 RepID=UPI003C2E5B47